MKPLLTTKQAAQILQVSPARAYELVRMGVVPCVRLGRQVRFDEEQLKVWIQQGGTAKMKGELGNAA